jgi:hypothetical protein
VLGAEYEDGAIEYIAQLDDPQIIRQIADGTIKHCNVEFEWKTLEKLNGHAPRGITFTGLSLLRDYVPGDPQTTVELWEAIISKLKESKIEEQASLRQFIYYQTSEPAAFMEDHFSSVWIDQTNGIQGIYGLLRDKPENPQPMALLFIKDKGWTTEKMEDWLSNPQTPEKPQPEPEAPKPLGEAIIASSEPLPSDLIPKSEVLSPFPEWEYQCPNCGAYVEPEISVCPTCKTGFDEKRWRVPPRFLKSHDAMSEYAQSFGA